MQANTETSGSPWPSPSKSRYHGVMHTGPVLLLDPVSLDASVVEPVLELVDAPDVVEPPVVGVPVLVPVVVVVVIAAPELPVPFSGPSWKHATNSKIGAR